MPPAYLLRSASICKSRFHGKKIRTFVRNHLYLLVLLMHIDIAYETSPIGHGARDITDCLSCTLCLLPPMAARARLGQLTTGKRQLPWPDTSAEADGATGGSSSPRAMDSTFLTLV